jgi:hypothetical protein
LLKNIARFIENGYIQDWLLLSCRDCHTLFPVVAIDSACYPSVPNMVDIISGFNRFVNLYFFALHPVLHMLPAATTWAILASVLLQINAVKALMST